MAASVAILDRRDSAASWAAASFRLPVRYNSNHRSASLCGERMIFPWTEIVVQASNYDEPTTLRCRRRPGRRPCGGLLTIFFDVDTFDVLWFCPNCDDNGRISGWEGTFWDSSEIAESTSGWADREGCAIASGGGGHRGIGAASR